MMTKKPFIEPQLQEELSLAAGTLGAKLVSGRVVGTPNG